MSKPKSVGAPAGNRNAAKPAGDRRSVRLVVLCSESEAEAIADRAGSVPVGRWIRETCLAQTAPPGEDT